MIRSRFVLHGVFLAALLLMSGCQAMIHEKGTILDPKQVESIQVGRTTQAEVRHLLGRPTFVNNFRAERWIYIQDRQFKNLQRTFSRAANRLEITFDAAGYVSEINRNFSDTLLDPTTLPEAQNDQSWFGWVWDGDYNRPATQGVDPDQMATQPPMAPVEQTADNDTPSTASSKANSGPWDPWWRFWPLEEADGP